MTRRVRGAPCPPCEPQWCCQESRPRGERFRSGAAERVVQGEGVVGERRGLRGARAVEEVEGAGGGDRAGILGARHCLAPRPVHLVRHRWGEAGRPRAARVVRVVRPVHRPIELRRAVAPDLVGVGVRHPRGPDLGVPLCDGGAGGACRRVVGALAGEAPRGGVPFLGGHVERQRELRGGRSGQAPEAERRDPSRLCTRLRVAQPRGGGEFGETAHELQFGEPLAVEAEDEGGAARSGGARRARQTRPGPWVCGPRLPGGSRVVLAGGDRPGPVALAAPRGTCRLVPAAASSPSYHAAGRLAGPCRSPRHRRLGRRGPP
eukprot:scaffold19891_cov84-Phaeocystis_antarctica.AAC.3